MENTISQRLKAFIAYKEISVREFERICGLSNGYVAGIKHVVLPEKMSNICRHFPDLNSVWLLTGEGEMIKNSGNFIQGDVNGGVVQSGGSHQNINISLPSEGEQKIIRPDGTVEVQKSDSNYTRLLEQRVEDLERIIKSKDEMIDLLKQINNK